MSLVPKTRPCHNDNWTDGQGPTETAEQENSRQSLRWKTQNTENDRQSYQ